MLVLALGLVSLALEDADGAQAWIAGLLLLILLFFGGMIVYFYLQAILEQQAEEETMKKEGMYNDNRVVCTTKKAAAKLHSPPMNITSPLTRPHARPCTPCVHHTRRPSIKCSICRKKFWSLSLDGAQLPGDYSGGSGG